MKTECLESAAAVYIYIYIKNTINNKVISNQKLDSGFLYF